MIKITLDFTKYTSHVELINDLSPAFNAGWEDDVDFRINLYSYSIIYSDMLAIVASAISYLRYKGVTISGTFLPFLNQKQADYASRVNFFQLVGLSYKESFLRHDSSGKFTEIRRFFSEKNSTDKISTLHQDIIRILHNCQVMKEVMNVLEFCLYEVLDNTLNHSKALNGWACCQYFKEKNEIRLIVLDTGIGIHKALTEYPASNYKDLTEEEAVLRCIEKGVTNGLGAGFGLWATSQFVRENGGEMLIYSGHHFLNCHEERPNVQTGAFWNGTLTYLKINTDISVDYKVIFGENSTRADDYDWFIEQNLGVSENLW